jgi:hypothetical protein
MKALDRIANSLEVIATLLADRPAQALFSTSDMAAVTAAGKGDLGRKLPVLPGGGELVQPGPAHYEPPADPGDEEPEAHIGPATEIADAGTPRARRRRGAVG